MPTITKRRARCWTRLTDDGYRTAQQGKPCEAPTSRELERAAWEIGWKQGHWASTRDSGSDPLMVATRTGVRVNMYHHLAGDSVPGGVIDYQIQVGDDVVIQRKRCSLAGAAEVLGRDVLDVIMAHPENVEKPVEKVQVMPIKLLGSHAAATLRMALMGRRHQIEELYAAGSAEHMRETHRLACLERELGIGEGE